MIITIRFNGENIDHRLVCLYQKIYFVKYWKGFMFLCMMPMDFNLYGGGYVPNVWIVTKYNRGGFDGGGGAGGVSRCAPVLFTLTCYVGKLLFNTALLRVTKSRNQSIHTPYLLIFYNYTPFIIDHLTNGPIVDLIFSRQN